MSTDSYLIPALFLITFAIAIAFGIYQYNKAKKARAEQHQSVQAKVRGERPGERHGGLGGSNATHTKAEQLQRPGALRS